MVRQATAEASGEATVSFPGATKPGDIATLEVEG